jgi:hypothetical protein
MEEIRDLRVFYHKLHKYRKLVEKLLGIRIKRSDRDTIGLEYNISELRRYISTNIGKIDYDEDILSYLSRIISYGDLGFKYISSTPEYKIFYEIRKLEKLVSKISDQIEYNKGTREFEILRERNNLYDRFEFLTGISEKIEEVLDNLNIDEDQSNQVHSGLLKERGKYIKSIRSTKVLPVRIGNALRGKPGRIEVKLNCGIVKPKLSGIYVLPYDYLKKRYSNEFISINYEQDLEILPNHKEIECNGEIVKLYKICILKVSEDVGEILMTYRFIYNKDRYNRAHWSYPFSEGSFYATFSALMLESLLK